MVRQEQKEAAIAWKTNGIRWRRKGRWRLVIWIRKGQRTEDLEDGKQDWREPERSCLYMYREREEEEVGTLRPCQRWQCIECT